MNDNTEVGFALSYEHMDLDQLSNTENNAIANLNSYRAAFYGAQHHGPMTFKAAAHYGYHNIDTDRHVVFTNYNDYHKADYTAHNFTGSLEASYNLPLGTKLTFQPYANLTYGYGLIESFDETGSAGLRAKSDGFHEGKSFIGVRASQKLTIQKMPATLNTNLGWKHRIGGTSPKASYSFAGTTDFQNQGLKRYRDALTLTPKANISLTFASDLYKSSASQTARAGVIWAF